MCLFYPVLCDRRSAWSHLSGHQRLNIRLLSSPEASQVLAAKEGNRGRDQEGLVVVLTYSLLIYRWACWLHTCRPSSHQATPFTFVSGSHRLWNKKQFSHVPASQDLCEFLWLLFCSWLANLWISVLRRGDCCWSWRELGLPAGVTACTRPSRWESVIVWLSLTSVVEAGIHGLMTTREREQVESTAASLCLSFPPRKWCESEILMVLSVSLRRRVCVRSSRLLPTCMWVAPWRSWRLSVLTYKLRMIAG